MKNKLILMGLLSLIVTPVFGAQESSPQAEAETLEDILQVMATDAFVEAINKPEEFLAVERSRGGGPLYFTPRVGPVMCHLEHEDRLKWSINAIKDVHGEIRKRKDIEEYLEKQLTIDPLIINYEVKDPHFLQRGDSINMPTLLMAAAYYNDCELVEFLLKRGAIVSHKDQKGRDARSVLAQGDQWGWQCLKQAIDNNPHAQRLKNRRAQILLRLKKRVNVRNQDTSKLRSILDRAAAKEDETRDVPKKIAKKNRHRNKLERFVIKNAEETNARRVDQENGREQKFSAQEDGCAQEVRPMPQNSDHQEATASVNENEEVEPQNNQKYWCTLCSFCYSDSKALEQHNIRIHRGQKNQSDVDQMDMQSKRKQAKEKQEQADDIQVKMPANAVNQAGPAVAKQAADEEKARAAAAAKEEKEQAHYDHAVQMFKDLNRRNALSKPENKQYLKILRDRYHGTKEEDAAIKKLAGIEPDRVPKVKPARQPVSQKKWVEAQQQPKKSGKQANTRGSSHATTQKNAQVSSKKAVQTPAKPKPLNPPGSRMAATEEELEAARTMQERQEQRAASSALREAAGPLDACYDEDAVLTHSAKLLGLDDNTPTLGHSKMKLIPHVHVPVLRTGFQTDIVNAALAGAEEKKKERSGKAQARPDIRVLTARDEQTDDGGMQWQSQELKEVFEEAQKCLSHVAGDDDDRDWTDWYE